MLYRKFHETVLNHFGFRSYVQSTTSIMGQSHLNHQIYQQNSQPPLPPANQMAQTHTGLPRRERTLSNESRKR